MEVSQSLDTSKNGRSENLTMTPRPATPQRDANTASRRGILTNTGSSKRKHFRELLNLLSTERKNWWSTSPRDPQRGKLFRELLNLLGTERKNWWRSSPGFFDTDESENESPDGTNQEKKRKMLVPPTPTQKKSNVNISGVWPHASDSDWSESEGGEDSSSPPDTPPSNEEIYDLLRELDQ
ncbi:ORF3 [Giant panda anellovirus]|uniref:ORF3 n=1 Tax=Giant panda anellovirus TaxID=2016460 RepID=A0A220IGJ7_9VIRU|nr:ORF3 [Giant panda anellovirus]ASH99114.1 ORF3 [Giant panda anellovirus]